MPLPQNYSTDTYDEMAAVRYRAWASSTSRR